MDRTPDGARVEGGRFTVVVATPAGAARAAGLWATEGRASQRVFSGAVKTADMRHDVAVYRAACAAHARIEAVGGASCGSGSMRSSRPDRGPGGASTPGARSGGGGGGAATRGVGARMRAGRRASNRRARHLPMRLSIGVLDVEHEGVLATVVKEPWNARLGQLQAIDLFPIEIIWIQVNRSESLKDLGFLGPSQRAYDHVVANLLRRRVATAWHLKAHAWTETTGWDSRWLRLSGRRWTLVQIA